MKHILLMVFALGLALAVYARAQAATNCFDYCLQAPGAGGPSNCATRCSPGGDLDVTHPFSSGPAYGAIAYGPRSTANGYAYDKRTAREASQTALSFCRQHGDDCNIVASYSNSCAAVAAIEDKGVFSVGQAETREQAQSRAMSVCTSQHGRGCEIEVWTCSKP